MPFSHAIPTAAYYQIHITVIWDMAAEVARWILRSGQCQYLDLTFRLLKKIILLCPLRTPVYVEGAKK